MRTYVSIAACCLVILSAKAQTLQEKLDQARQKWPGYQDYDFHYNDNCYPCPEEKWKTKSVSVRNNTIESVAFDEYWGSEQNSETVPEEIINGIRTVDELFDFIQEAIDLSLEPFVHYHYDYGYPWSVKVEFNVTDKPDVDQSLSNMVPLQVTIEREQDLTAAKSRWDSLGNANQNYDYIWERYGFLPPEYLIPVLVQVRNGSVSRFVNAEDNSELPEGWFSPVPISEMFDMIEGAIDDLVPRLDVRYDKQNGSPDFVVIDFDERIADEELYWYNSNLTFVSGTTEETPPPCQNTIAGCQSTETETPPPCQQTLGGCQHITDRETDVAAGVSAGNGGGGLRKKR